MTIALALAIWKAIGLRGALAIGFGLALLITGLRLNHAKFDQFDHRSCVAGKPCSPTKWEAEAKADERDILTLTKQAQADALSIATLQQAVDQQNAAIDAAKAAGEAREARASQMVAEARRTGATALQRAREVLAAKPTTDDHCAAADALILRGSQ